MNTSQRTTRSATRTGVAALSAGLVAASGLLVVGASQASSTPRATSSTVNPVEHRAHLVLAEARQQARRSQDCTEALAEASAWLGHASDGMETFVLSQPPCTAG